MTRARVHGGDEAARHRRRRALSGDPPFSAYRALGYRDGQFPNAERIGRETVTLPLFPAMELGDVERVVAAVNDIVRGARK